MTKPKPGARPQKPRKDKGKSQGPRRRLVPPCPKCGGLNGTHSLDCKKIK